MDTSLFKLNKNAFSILSGAYAKMPAIAIQAIDAEGSPKQPKYQNQLIQVGSLWEQIMESVVLNGAGTAIIGIQGEDVSVINALLTCLKDAADLTSGSAFPAPLNQIVVNTTVLGGYEVGPPGSILVSNGITYIVLPPGPAGSVLTSDGAGNLIYSSVVGNGLPAGGLAGQHLVKNSNTSYDVIWQTQVFADNSDVTTSAAEVNILTGVNTGSVGAAQINTLIGINTGLTIQQQLDALGTPALPNGQFWVGNVSNIATPHLPAGDVTFDNTGLFAIQPNVIVNADVSTTAGIMRSKLASGSSNRVVINNNAGVMIDAAAILPFRALISDANGIPTHSNTTSTALGFISTLVSNAQTQLNSKLTVSLTSVAEGDMLKYDGTNWVNFPIGTAGQVLISDGTTADWGSATANGLPTGGTTHQYLRKIDATNFNTEWHTLLLADVTNVVTTATEVNLLSGLTVNATKLNYTTDVTSNIQAQLNTKLPIALTHHSIWIGGPSDTAVQTSAGVDGSVLTIVSGHPTWQTPPLPGTVSGTGSSTDNAITRWSGTGGTLIQDSGVILDDTNNITGVASLSSGQIDILNQAALRLHETGSTNYVGIRAAGTMAADYTITLPAAAPGSNTALTYDGANYVWSASGGASTFLALTDTPSSYTGQAGKIVAVNVGETALEFIAAGAGTVTSVSGTSNRITSTGGATPVIDIAATYVGQTSITTLGTVATGTWNATNISLGKGGTGATLVAPGVDSIMFYDFSAGFTAYLTLGTGLSIAGTVISATGSYTDEQAQDAVGNILLNTTTINFTYDDATPNISAIVNNNSIGNAQIRQSAGLSVIGRSANTTGNVADIVGTDGQVLRVSGTTLGFGSVLGSSITMSTNRMLGRTTASTGAAEEITVENGLTLASLTLKLGGALTGNTTFTGAGFNYTATGLGTYSFSATSATLTTPAGATISVANNVVQSLSLGATGGAVLNLGSDAAGDMYYRDSGGKFIRMLIGEVGQTMIVNDSGLPDWSNMIPEDAGGLTYLFKPEDNGKRIRFTHASGCTATIPVGTLPPGWMVLCYRANGAGTTTFVGATIGVTLEGAGTTIPAQETSAAIYHRGSDFYELTGAVSAIGTGTVTSVDLASITAFATASGGPINTTGTLTYTLNIQPHNTIFSGPSGLLDPDAIPTFRSMVLDDLPEDDWVEISGTTYTLQSGDDKRVLWVSNAAGCTITIPSGRVEGYAVPVYRKPTAGTVTFVAGVGVTLEGVAATISVAETMAAVMHQGGDVYALVGSLGTGGGGATNFTDLLDVPSSYSGQTLKAVRVNAGETGLEFFTISGTGTVTSVSGTTDRITITGTPSINPTVDIAATYVGQTSITTLGTIGTGTWNATNISLAKGGTGSSLTDPGADRIMFWDESGNTVDWLTVSNALTISTTDLKWGGALTADTAITGAFRLDLGTTASKLTAFLSEVGGSGSTILFTQIQGGVTRRFGLADGIGTILDVGSDATGDIYQRSSGGVLTRLASVATGNVLISGGVSTINSWGKVGLTTHVTGTLPVANGGTGITTLGSANQVFAVNNAGTANEYKTLSLGTTPQSNDLGWVLTGANAIVLHVPDASATVRGVVTTGTQTFAGPKTFNASTFNVTGTKTATTTGEFHSNFTGTFTGSSTNGHIFYGVHETQALTFGTYSTGVTTMVAHNIAPTFTTSGVTGSGNYTAIGLRYAPNSVPIDSHVAAQFESGVFRIGTSTGTSMLNVSSPTGINILNLIGNAVPRLSLTVAGQLSNVVEHSVSGGTTASGTRIGYTISVSAPAASAGTSDLRGVQVGGTINVTGSYTGTYYGVSFSPTVTNAVGMTIKAWEHRAGYVQWNSLLSPSQITSNQNDYDPTGWNTGGTVAGASIIRLDTDASRNLTSLIGGAAGRLAIIANIGSNNLVLTDDDGSTGTAANRFGLNANITLAAEQSALAWYDGTSSRWRVIGAWAAGGGGITNSAATDEMMKSNGTNAVPSGIFSASSANMTMGSGSISGNRTITAESSDASSAIVLAPKSSSNQRTVAFGVFASGGISGSNDIGDILIGADVLSGSERTITAGTQTGGIANLGIRSSGSSATITLYTGATYFKKGLSATDGSIQIQVGYSGDTEDLITQNNATTASKVFAIRSANGEGTLSNNARNMLLEGGAGNTISGNGNGGSITIRSGLRRTAGSGTDGNITIDQLTGNLIVGTASGKLSFFNATAVVKQTSGANLTNNVTSGGTNDQIDDFTSLTVYATDAAAIRNAIYQLSRKLKQINDGLRTYGLFT